MRRRIGSGAFATVWLAYDEHLDSPVAIKVLADNWTGDLHIRQRFVEEGRFLRKVESPHVVTVYDAGELPDERPYLVMAYADQGTLADRLELCGLEPSQALTVLTQVGRGLTALHDRGVLHRDVKPANVLFRTVESARGAQVVAMVGDLGLGKAMDMSSRLTMVGGTPTYVAPEQAQGEGLDGRADQFSLAALGYYLLAGRQPFDHTTLAAAEDPAPPPPMGIGNPEAEAVVLKALSKDRDDRFEDVESFTSALVEALGGQVEEAPLAWVPADPELTQAAARPDGHRPDARLRGRRAPRRRRRRLPWLVAGIVALAGGFGIGWAAEQSSTSERTVRGRDREDRGHRARVLDDPGRPRAVGPAARGADGAARARDRVEAGLEHRRRPGAGRLRRPPRRARSCPPASRSTSPARATASRSRTCRTATSRRRSSSTGCPGADVIVERVVQVTSNRLLWIQVASDDERHGEPGAGVGDDLRLLGPSAGSSRAAQRHRLRDPADQLGHPRHVGGAAGDRDLDLRVVGAGEVEPGEEPVAQVVAGDVRVVEAAAALALDRHGLLVLDELVDAAVQGPGDRAPVADHLLDAHVVAEGLEVAAGATATR